jgi:signal transduction histidine kinase
MRFIYLYLTAFFIGIAFWLYIVEINPSLGVSQQAYLLQNEIEKEIQLVEQEVEMITKSLETDSYQQLQGNVYPFFIFRQQQLVFWSDNKIVPSYEQLSGSYCYKMIFLRQGKFVARQLNWLTAEKERLEIFVLVPLYLRYPIENNYLQSGWNKAIFSDIIPQNLLRQKSNNSTDIFAPDGTFLFSVSDFKQLPNMAFRWTFLIAAILGVCCFLLFIVKNIGIYTSVSSIVIWCIFGVILVIIRWLMLFYIPQDWLPERWFDPHFYASSVISPSLGDLWLNSVLLTFWVILFTKKFPKSKWYAHLAAIKRPIAYVWAIGLVFLHYAALIGLFVVVRSLYFDAQWNLDITESVSFSPFKIMALMVFVLLSVSYFSIAHVLLQSLLRFCKKQPIVMIMGVLIGTGLGWGISTVFFSEIADNFVLLLHFLYVVVLLRWRFPISLYSFRQQTYLYWFFASLICAAVGANSLYHFRKTDNLLNKQKFISQILTDNDVLGEMMLNEAMADIQRDNFIRNRLISPFASKTAIEQKIKKFYLGNYFDKYEVQVLLFDAMGLPLNHHNILHDYNEFVAAFAQEEYATDFTNIFYLNDFDNYIFKRYLCFIPLYEGNLINGYIILDLSLKNENSLRVYPALLIDKRFEQPFQEKNYQYAIVENNRIIYQFGAINLNGIDLNDIQLQQGGIYKNDKHYLAVCSAENRLFVVASVQYSFLKAFTNFSYLFIILTFCLIVLTAIRLTWLNWKRKGITFFARIQALMYVVFVVPLVMLSVFIVTLLANEHKIDTEKNYREKATLIANYLQKPLIRFFQYEIELQELYNLLNEVAELTVTDINLYQNNGKLLLSNQEMIYQKELISTYINPVAYWNLTNTQEKIYVKEETLGNLRYASVFAAIYDNNGERLGLFSVPFFEAQSKLEEQKITVIATILNVFTVVYIFFLAVSYWASQLLVSPLRFIATRLGNTTLENNQPLQWKANDEIGLLVREYNQMLQKLAASKRALADSEKESAWREMAKQVAHEIKNPLTPMKLTLQNLQRQLEKIELPDTQKEKTKRSVENLLLQIETLNDIATSFAAFAKMPAPQLEQFDIVHTVKCAVELHESHQSIVCHLPATAIKVIGDEKLTGQIMTNLLLNAFQSVPAERPPHIEVNLQITPKNTVLISVKDNGIGIPKDIQHKVFLPNFSTKFSGSGIGLALAKRGIEHAGGKIWFDTTENEGTTFWIEIEIWKP